LPVVPFSLSLSFPTTNPPLLPSPPAPVIRLGLHPVDMRHRFSREYWLRTLRTLLSEGRQPLTKIDWLERHLALDHAA
ncbi:hypothetical protein ACWWC3_04595, partial [Pseudomonas aeruginosa]